MKLVSYEVTNWGPHQAQKLIFPKEAKTIAICGENDQGKSWILRGIAFTLSIGRNEYGDQSSIHIGEKEASHKLTIEHNDKQYTIEKVVKGKSSEDEGTSTWINGEKKDRASLEEFYYSTLGLPHPNVWIPICISMQNQTDFHLRGKKRDREEALRLACQLTKIDAWKDSLSSLVREEEKSLTESMATIRAKIDMLGAQIKEISEAEKKYRETLKSLEAHKTHHHSEITKVTDITEENRAKFWSDIKTNSELIKELIKELNRKELEATNLQKEGDLLTSICIRNEKELSVGLEDKIEVEDLRIKLQCLQAKLHELKLLDAKKRASKCVDTLNQLEKKIKDFEEKLSKKKIENHQEILAKDYRSMSEIEGIKNKINLLNESHNLNLPDIMGKSIKAYQKRADNFRRLLEATLEDNIETYQEALESISKISKTGGDISANAKIPNIPPVTYYKWKLANLQKNSNKAEGKNELIDCPVCQTSTIPEAEFEKRPEGDNQVVINDLAKSLNEEIYIKISQKLGIDLNTKTNFENALAAREETKKSLQAFEKLNLILNDLKNIIKEILERYTHPASSLEDLRLDEIEAKIKENIEYVKSLVSTKEELEWSKREKNLTTNELLQLEKNIEEIEKEGKLLEVHRPSIDESLIQKSSKELLVKYANFSQEEITDGISKTRLKLREMESLKEKNTKKARELDHSKAKLGLLEKNLSERKSEISSITKRLEACDQLPIPLPIPTELEEINGFGSRGSMGSMGSMTLVDIKSKWQIVSRAWEDRLNKYEKLRALSEELPEKKRKLKTQQLDLLESLEKEDDKSNKILKAKELMEFLDYKKAPRVLLEHIVDQLFYVTNKLAEALSIETNLVRGKNLEFLTRQTRHSKILEQKTERLGFGKGAILGICFRLACQKLLLPETGFLLLDEPTANVDNKRKSALKTFLQALSETSESKTNQIILIEHDQDVVELCQSKIEISSTTKL